MKKIYSLIMVSAIALTANAQMKFNENFTGYSNGNLVGQGPVATKWTTSGSGSDVQVASASPLIYPGYESGTQYVTVAATDGIDPYRLFIPTGTPTPTSSFSTASDVSVFVSFIVRVTSASVASNTSPYSISIRNSADNDIPVRFYISSESANASKVRFGILAGNNTNSNSIAWTPETGLYNINTTYLIVIRYDILSAPGNNDDAYLWVNPDLTTEPNGNSVASYLNGNEANFGDQLDALQISQNGTNAPVAAFDAFRVAYGTSSALAWSNLAAQGAPLPVRLTSFNAAEEGLSTKIIWNTAEENGITSYVVEKSTDGRTFTAIGTVKATNQKTYSFTDAQSTSENSYYRLKMVEMDGSYKLSYIVSLKSKVSLTITTSPNPVKNALMIQHPKVATDGHIQIVSANGQMLKDIRLAANAVISNVDMSGFTSGLYHIVFKSGSDVFSKTVIKQ
jgi:hypothetical protein